MSWSSASAAIDVTACPPYSDAQRSHSKKSFIKYNSLLHKKLRELKSDVVCQWFFIDKPCFLLPQSQFHTTRITSVFIFNKYGNIHIIVNQGIEYLSIKSVYSTDDNVRPTTRSFIRPSSCHFFPNIFSFFYNILVNFSGTNTKSIEFTYFFFLFLIPSIRLKKCC